MTGHRHRRRVLVVDDERLIADTLAQILIASGFSAEVAYSGEQAVEMASRVHPDVLIADVIMGGINGVESAMCINNALPECRVILCSGQIKSEELVHKAEELGYKFEFLLKPVHPNVLLNRLRNLLRLDGAA